MHGEATDQTQVRSARSRPDSATHRTAKP